LMRSSATGRLGATRSGEGGSAGCGWRGCLWEVRFGWARVSGANRSGRSGRSGGCPARSEVLGLAVRRVTFRGAGPPMRSQLTWRSWSVLTAPSPQASGDVPHRPDDPTSRWLSECLAGVPRPGSRSPIWLSGVLALSPLVRGLLVLPRTLSVAQPRGSHGCPVEPERGFCFCAASQCCTVLSLAARLPGALSPTAHPVA